MKLGVVVEQEPKRKQQCKQMPNEDSPGPVASGKGRRLHMLIPVQQNVSGQRLPRTKATGADASVRC